MIDSPITNCPLLIHLSLPPLPADVDLKDVKRYDEELRNPSGLRTSLRRPPSYWQQGGLGGVMIADQCGFAIGLEGGTGMKLEDFWRKTCNCRRRIRESIALENWLIIQMPPSQLVLSLLCCTSLYAKWSLLAPPQLCPKSLSGQSFS